MRLFDILRSRRPSSDPRFIGCWHLARCEGPLDVHHGVELDIRANGTLLYSVDTGPSWQIGRLVWRVEGTDLITDQPSAPREHRSRFAFEVDGLLRLDDPDSRTWYERGPKRAPQP